MGVVDGVIVLSSNFWTTDTWFTLAELAFSHVWLVAHSTYRPCTIYTFGGHLCYSLANQEIHIRIDFFLFPLMKNMQRC